MKIGSVFIFLLLFFAGAVETVPACAIAPDGTPVCAHWTRADAVFSGKVLKVEDAPKNEGFPEGARKVRFQVQRNFKGVDNPTFTIVALPDCGLNVKSGQTWIVYAANDIVVKSFSAFRAVKIEPKTTSEEAAALENIKSGKSDTSIAGRFVSTQNTYGFEPVEISVAGQGKSFSARTDASGAFSVAVPDGNYKVELKLPYDARFKWDENLLGTSFTEGVPTVFKYDVRLNDGDCHFSFFEVSKID
ncbi:MAG TPA: hypothetical protein VIL74_16870 [Pyrinomonadaceae bacterium]|jgi:hypothetical protein